jgi:hypothetical protein
VRYAVSRFAEAFRSAGTRRSEIDGSRVDLGAVSLGQGRGARSAARLLGLQALAIGATFAIGVGSASAAFLHPAQNYAFGSSGTSGSTFSQPRDVAFHQSDDRIYVLAKQSPSTIHAFTFAGPALFNPVGGSWPLEVENVRLDAPGIGVDNTTEPSAGHIVYSYDCGCPTSNVYGYDESGNGPLFVFSVANETETGESTPATGTGVAIDSHGNIWVANNSPNTIEEFAPSGGAAIRRIGTVPFGNSPNRLAFDSTNDDLYVGTQAGIVRLRKATNYAVASAETLGGVNNSSGLAVDGPIHRMYATPFTGAVKVFNTTTGTLVEEMGSGGHRGIAVDESTHDVFVVSTTESRVQEWRAVPVPDVTTGSPVGNTKVSGSVGLGSSGLEVTECYFEFGFTTSYGTKEKCAPEAPYTTEQEVTADLPGLFEEQTYHYRLVAKNTNGFLSKGEDLTITPGHVAFLKTKPATNIQRLSGTLNGSYDGTGEDTHYYFEWGATPSLGESTPEEDAGITNVPTEVSAEISGLESETPYYYRVVAENAKGKTKATDVLSFTTAPSVKDLLTEGATSIDTSSATLNASLDPDGYATDFYFEYGRTTRYGHTAPAPPGEPVGSESPGTTNISADVEELEPGLLYHFRVVATNSFGTTIGPDETFTTRQVPSITSFSSTNIGATSADLTASINPNGAETNYFFEYGTSESYGSRAPVPDGSIPAGNSPEDIVAHIEGLTEVTYHFRLTAENTWGSTTSEDQTFDFALPAGCPNHSVRQQTRAGYLPDCRAYELVSPGQAGGTFLFPEGPNSAYASSTGRLAFAGFFNAIPDSGEPMVGSLNGDLYVSSRTDSGWTTRYVGIPGSHSLSQSAPWAQYYEGQGPTNIPSDIAMDRYLVWDRGQKGFFPGGILEGSYAPYMYDNQGNFLRRLPTNVEEIEGATKDVTDGGFTGYERPSPDFSHYVFTSTSLVFAEGGLTEAPGSVYDNNIEDETVKVVSKTPAGEPIPRDPGAPPLFRPNGGTEPEYLKVPAVSDDGSHILMSTMGPGSLHAQVAREPSHLYMSVNAAVFYEVSLGDDMENHVVNLEGMTSDGSKVYFTSAEQLTADDTDNSVDLFQWSENGGAPTVTRVSTGTGETGNSDSCEVAWTSNCDVEVVPVDESTFAVEGNGPPTDNAIDDETGEVYFYSPEELDTTHGAFGSRNVYVYREGRPRHVATLEPSKPLRRIQVTPDGQHMAMITNSRLTAYDNNSASEMYTYEPATRTTVCVSCRPDGGFPESQVEGSLNGRFLTDDGRAFFSTGDALVPRDSDGIQDVYEFVAGRPQLITTGTGEASQSQNTFTGLVGVSADGTDAFFATNDTLVAADENGPFLKFYDARSNGGFLLPDPPTPCVAADECHGKETDAPAPLSIGTGAALGAGGNTKSATKKRCSTKGKKSKRKCRKKKRRGHRRRHTRRHHRGGRNG